ncbi:phage major tail tube protein [Scandinavium goeteborgense]|uniref:phage major tail tube protein n=1 Tax=Scandinavium goeteborgense TaxID=1851514 RepID=UPI0021650D7B|nr:phage major tail tube protein [Scandinavium goeteborgense]MCS2152373.1 phage major tail tube protein [Scandinavium goeteborgense]
MAVYRGCSLFLNSVRLSDSVAYTPPEISVDVARYKAGAMPVPVGVPRGIKPMTAHYKIAGMDPTAFLFLGLTAGARARLTVRRVYRVGETVVFLHDELEGFIDSIRTDEHGSDSKLNVGQEMSMTVNYYRVSVDGVQSLLEINAALGTTKIMGVDPQRISGAISGILT